MMPFHGLSQQLVTSLARGGNLNITRCYYFHNYIEDELYTNPQWEDEKLLEKVLQELHPNHTLTIIFSDAGAARGGYNVQRVAAIEALLELLRSHTHSLVWLNPIPRTRWTNTTASAIHRLLNGAMFEFTQQGWQKAIATLLIQRGRASIISFPG
jgi:uncharacterized protein